MRLWLTCVFVMTEIFCFLAVLVESTVLVVVSRKFRYTHQHTHTSYTTMGTTFHVHVCMHASFLVHALSRNHTKPYHTFRLFSRADLSSSYISVGRVCHYDSQKIRTQQCVIYTSLVHTHTHSLTYIILNALPSLPSPYPASTPTQLPYHAGIPSL